jgi:hypothetical protein
MDKYEGRKEMCCVNSLLLLRLINRPREKWMWCVCIMQEEENAAKDEEGSVRAGVSFTYTKVRDV